jgi:hypothetical protein
MTSKSSSYRLLSRRGLIKNTALMTLLAPVLRKQDAFGQAAASPRRVVFIFSPNGPMNAAGPAKGSTTDFTIHDWWKALEPHRADGIFLSHMAPTGAGVVGGAGHGLGGQTFRGGGGDSVDQVIAKGLEAQGKAGLKRSVIWGTSGASRSGGADVFSLGGRKIAPELSPQKAWAELFANFMAPAGGSASPEQVKRAQILLAQEKSVLDFVNTDCRALKNALGKEGMALLDDHCTTVRSMEEALMSGLAMPAATGKCPTPADPGSVDDWANPENIDRQMATFVELIATSFACELTRVVAFQFGGHAARNRLASKYGIPSSPRADSGDSGPAHHPWTHQPNSATRLGALRTFIGFYASKVGALVEKLKTTMDANGKPLLDSTMVLWASELGGLEGGSDWHQVGGVPVLLFGRGQGTFKTGRYIRGKSGDRSTPAGSGAGMQEPGRDMARALISMIQYMGFKDINRFGRSDATGPLTSLYG